MSTKEGPQEIDINDQAHMSIPQGVEVEETEDTRNHLTLVQDKHLRMITRLSTRQIVVITRYQVLHEYWKRRREKRPMMIGELKKLWSDIFTEYMISLKGLGREELVEAMRSDRFDLDLRDVRDIPGETPQRESRRGWLRGRGLGEK